MTKDNLFTGEKARESLMKGVSKVADAVGRTMGTAGDNSLIECIENPGHFSTNDGYTIASSIRLSDPMEEIGRGVLLEAISKANKQSGDGSSTTCVLTAAILEEGKRYIGKESPMEIKRSLEQCIPVIESVIDMQKKEIGVEDISPVASISAEDKEIGDRIQEIYKEIGKDGVIQWDISKTSFDTYTIGSGVTMNGATYVSPYMCDIDQKGRFTGEIRWKDVPILLTQQKITSSLDFESLFANLYNQNIREIAIFCDDIEVPVVSDLIQTRAARGFKTAVIKMPVLWKDEWWEDLALATGATIIGSVSGISLRNAKQEHLGKVGNLVVSKEDTFFDGINDLSEHIKNLTESGEDKNLLRASRLNTKTARYFVGAHSESALAYRRLKVEDAINAASCALDGGIVPGGGLTLFNASYNLPDTIGGKILKKALKSPIRQIISNSGRRVPERQIGGNLGVNTRNGEVVDMMKTGIVDPANVVLNAVRNAIGVSASILTTGTVITLPNEGSSKL